MTRLSSGALRITSWIALAASVACAAVAFVRPMEDASSVRGWGLACIVFAGMAFAAARAAGQRAFRAIELAMNAVAEGDLSARVERHQSGAAFRVASAITRAQRTLTERIDHAKAQRDELQAIVEALGNGLLALDREQRVRSANRVAEQLLGLLGDYRGKLLQQSTRQPELSRFIADAFSAHGHLGAEIRLEGVEPLVVQVACEPLPGRDGRIDGLLLVMDDITRLKRLESMRTDFAANVSHELRTPITNIKGYVETLQEVGFADPAQTEHFIEIIHRNTRRLSTLVEDLLSLASLDQLDPRTGLEFEDLGVHDVLAEVATEIADAAAAKGVRVVLPAADDLVVYANRTLLHQAIANLVSNAIKYSPSGSRVVVTAASHEGVVNISVSDDGPGIAAKHLPRLFERFYRIDKARSREMGGTGLGLALVKHIALAHGGVVDVQSAVGQGSTFSLRLPTADQGRTALPARQS